MVTRARAPGLRDDQRFAVVLLGVQHLVSDALLLEQPREELRGLDRRRADEHRLLARGALADVLDDRVVLVLLRQVDEIGRVVADHRLVRRHHDHFEPVDLLELEGLGVGGAGHAGELVVHPEVVLERDRGDRLVLLAHPHAFLGLDRLVQAVGPAAARHRAAGELVDDDHFAVADDVLDVLAVQRVRAQRRVQVVHQPDVGRVVEALPLGQQSRLQEQLLDPLVAGVGEVHLLAFLVGPVVAVALFAVLPLQARHDLVDPQVELGALLGGSRDDQRRARFVDQDRVDLVDDRVLEAALHPVLEAEREVVAQVVEAELVVGAEGDVGAVGRALLVGRLAGPHDADVHAEEAVDRAHPLGVAAGEVVVDGDDVGALARQRVQVRRQRRDQGLALAGAHLGDLALVQHHAADHLHVEMPQAERAARRLADDGEGLGQQVVERLAGGELVAELARLGSQVGIREGLQRRLERVDLADEAGVLADETLVAATKDAGKPIGHWGSGRGWGKAGFYRKADSG